MDVWVATYAWYDEIDSVCVVRLLGVFANEDDAFQAATDHLDRSNTDNGSCLAMTSWVQDDQGNYTADELDTDGVYSPNFEAYRVFKTKMGGQHGS